MNPIHKAFAGEPALKLTLAGLFDLVDGMGAQERFEYLSPVMQAVLMQATFRAKGARLRHGIPRTVRALQGEVSLPSAHVHHGFLAYAIVAQTLAWLCISSDENHMKHALENQTTQIQESEEALRAGQIAKEQHERTVRECEERTNNLSSDRALTQDRYNRFCERVVKPFLYYPPEAE